MTRQFQPVPAADNATNKTMAILQRKCACGKPASPLREECPECQARLGLQTKLTIGASDAKAARSASEVNAHAYTVGNHVAFGSGKFAPENPAGRELSVKVLPKCWVRNCSTTESCPKQIQLLHSKPALKRASQVRPVRRQRQQQSVMARPAQVPNRFAHGLEIIIFALPISWAVPN